MSQRNKRARLTDEASDTLKSFCRLGRITNAGLQELLSKLRNNPELLGASRLDISHEFQARFNAVRTTITVELVGGGTWDWPIADPGLLLQKVQTSNICKHERTRLDNSFRAYVLCLLSVWEVINECPKLCRLYLEALTTNPCSRDRPWHTLVGFDEFTPGDKLKVNNQRKCMVLSLTFLELGAGNLGRDAVWATPVVVRHTMVDSVVGGWSRMLKLFLDLLFCGPNGLQTVGIPITVGGVNLVLWACMGRLLSDGDGLRMALDWKGASGLKPCFRHWNVVSKTSELANDELVDITCADFRRFRVWKTGEIEATIDMLTEGRLRVNAGTMTATRLDQLEKACGFNANPAGLMADVPTRARFHAFNVSTFDWVHTALQNGTVTEEAFLYTKACRHAGFHPRDLEAYLQDNWIFPAATRSKGKGLHRVFNEFRAHSSQKADRLKASASEMLGLYGLLRHWSATEVGDRPELTAERASFEAACEVIDILLRTKRGFIDLNVAAHMLRRAVTNHMTLHMACYGGDHIKPKHHWMFDVADQLTELPCVVDAFIIERLHLRVKRMLEPVYELGVLERSVLCGLVNAQFEEAKKDLGDGLTGTKVMHDGCWVADHASVGALRLGAGDAIFNGAELGIVVVLVEDDGIVYVAVRGCEYRSQVGFCLCLIFYLIARPYFITN